MKTRHHLIGYAVLGPIIAAFIVLSFTFPSLRQFASVDYVRTFVLGFGILGFAVYMALVALSVPLPVPSTALVIVGGVIFGTPIGFILALISMLIGSSISFAMGRFGGRRLVEKLVDLHHLAHFGFVLEKRGLAAALISYTIPIFPSDAVSFIIGLTKISYRQFIMVASLGHIPRVLIIILLGADIAGGVTLKTLWVLLAAAAFVLVVLFRVRIEKFVFFELRQLHLYTTAK